MKWSLMNILRQKSEQDPFSFVPSFSLFSLFSLTSLSFAHFAVGHQGENRFNLQEILFFSVARSDFSPSLSLNRSLCWLDTRLLFSCISRHKRAANRMLTFVLLLHPDDFILSLMYDLLLPLFSLFTLGSLSVLVSRQNVLSLHSQTFKTSSPIIHTHCPQTSRSVQRSEKKRRSEDRLGR